MTVGNALDGVYSTGIKDERERVRYSLIAHLKDVHNFSDTDVSTTIRVLGLHQNPKLINYADPQCNVCGVRYTASGEETKQYYGESLHEECVPVAEASIPELFGEED